MGIDKATYFRMECDCCGDIVQYGSHDQSLEWITVSIYESGFITDATICPRCAGGYDFHPREHRYSENNLRTAVMSFLKRKFSRKVEAQND